MISDRKSASLSLTTLNQNNIAQKVQSIRFETTNSYEIVLTHINRIDSKVGLDKNLVKGGRARAVHNHPACARLGADRPSSVGTAGSDTPRTVKKRRNARDPSLEATNTRAKSQVQAALRERVPRRRESLRRSSRR